MQGMKAFETRPPAQHFAEKKGAVLRMADGGMFDGIKRSLGMAPPETVTQKYARQDAERAAKNPPPAVPPPATPAPAPNTISGYAGMAAMQRREKEAGLKDGGELQTGQGGHVPGTGTGDKIPAKYEPGEFVVSNDMLAANPGMREQLHAVREQVLASQGKTPEQADARNAGVIEKLEATAQGSQSQGFKPELFFDTGGSAGDEEKKRLQNQSAMYVQGAQAAAAARPPEPAPAIPANPSAATAPAAGLSYMDNNQAVGQQIKDSFNKGNYGEAAGQAFAGSVGMFTTPLTDLAVRGGAAAWEGAKGFGRGMLGMSADAALPTSTPASPTAPIPAAAKTTPAGAQPGAQPGAPAANPVPPAQAPEPGGSLPDPRAASTAGQVMPGVYQHGRGQYSDNAAGMGLTAGFTGQPSAQNQAAAQALSDRGQQQALARGMGGIDQQQAGPSMFIMPDSSRADRERKSLVDSLMSPMKGAQNSQLTASQRQGMVGLLDAERRDASGNRQADQTAATQRDVATMREQGDMGRSVMREQGENTRAGARNQIDERRVGLDERGQAPKLREAERMDALRTRYEAAKPEDRKAIAQQIRELQGNNVQQDVWAHSPGGQVIDPKTQQLITQPGVLYNRATGEVRSDSGANKLPPISENPAVQQIMNNTALSREERAKQIRALGYK